MGSGRGSRSVESVWDSDRPLARPGLRTHEDVVCFRTVAADLEQLHEVEELAVDVAADLMSALTLLAAHRHGTVDVLDVALVHEDLLCLEAEFLDAGLRDDLASLQLLDLPALISWGKGRFSSLVKVGGEGHGGCTRLGALDREDGPFAEMGRGEAESGDDRDDKRSDEQEHDGGGGSDEPSKRL